MAIRDQYRFGETKQRTKIVTSDPTHRKLEGHFKDGGICPITIWETPPLFVWPQVGEVWTVRREGLYWILGSRQETSEETLPIEDLQPGEGKITGNRVFTNDGRLIVTVDISEAEDGQVVTWDAAGGAFVLTSL